MLSKKSERLSGRWGRDCPVSTEVNSTGVFVFPDPPFRSPAEAMICDYDSSDVSFCVSEVNHTYSPQMVNLRRIPGP